MAAPVLPPPPVQFGGCPGWELARYSTEDANFRVLVNGTVLVRHHTELRGAERTFVVQAWDPTGPRSSAVVTVRNKGRHSPQVTCREHLAALRERWRHGNLCASVGCCGGKDADGAGCSSAGRKDLSREGPPSAQSQGESSSCGRNSSGLPSQPWGAAAGSSFRDAQRGGCRSQGSLRCSQESFCCAAMASLVTSKHQSCKCMNWHCPHLALPTARVLGATQLNALQDALESSWA